MSNKIPKVIYQTFKTKNLSKEMNDIVDSWKLHNTNYEYILYDNNECKEFIRSFFDSKVIDAYYKLRYGALRADLWRYCILYKYGGVYADLDTLCLDSIDNFITNKTEIMVPKDLWNSYHIFNSFIAIVPNHPIMDYCIKKIVNNVQNKINYPDKRDVTGPGVLGKSINKYLNRPEKKYIDFSNTYNIEYLELLEFKRPDEYVTNQDCSKRLFQNKNGNPIISEIYAKETNKNKIDNNWSIGSPYL